MKSLGRKKKVQECDYVFGSSTTFQRRKEWICESRCRQVSVRLRVFARFFLPLNTSTTTVYAWSAFYPSLRFTLSLQSAFYTQFAFYPWSAVRSLRFTLTAIIMSLSCNTRTSQYFIQAYIFIPLIHSAPFLPFSHILLYSNFF